MKGIWQHQTGLQAGQCAGCGLSHPLVQYKGIMLLKPHDCSEQKQKKPAPVIARNGYWKEGEWRVDTEILDYPSSQIAKQLEWVYSI